MWATSFWRCKAEAFVGATLFTAFKHSRSGPLDQTGEEERVLIRVWRLTERLLMGDRQTALAMRNG